MNLKRYFKTDLIMKTLAIGRVAKPRIKILVLASLCTTLASLFQLVGLGLIVPVMNGG